MGDSVASLLIGAGSCGVSDALDRLGVRPALTGMTRLSTRQTIAGPAVTVQLGKAAAASPAPAFHLAVDAIVFARPGAVIVVANRGDVTAGAWGGLLGRAAKAAGIVAAVVDGAVRDVDELEALRFPTFGRQPIPISARGRFAQLASGQPVDLSGEAGRGSVRIRPGDWIVADGSGVVCVPAEHLCDVTAAVSEILEAESAFIRRMEGGDPLEHILDAGYDDLTRKRRE